MNYNKLFIDENIPELLTKEQEYIYLKKYQMGDNDARDQLILHNIKLIIDYVYEKFPKINYDQDELISVGLDVLIKHVNNFKFENNCNFRSYLIYEVDSTIKRFLKKEGKYNDRKIETIDICCFEQDDIADIQDFSVDFVTLLEDKFECQKVKDILNDLPYIDKKIIYLYFGKYKCTQAYIANILGCTQQNVSMKIKTILRKVSFLLKRKGVIENQSEKIKLKK